MIAASNSILRASSPDTLPAEFIPGTATKP
jgi:hypothetical protein